ncbi:hypothetical protein DN600_10615 [Aeromonas caviae]|nr:hypothetical protein DN600_10615 [Aeromonas caviae]
MAHLYAVVTNISFVGEITIKVVIYIKLSAINIKSSKSFTEYHFNFLLLDIPIDRSVTTKPLSFLPFYFLSLDN